MKQGNPESVLHQIVEILVPKTKLTFSENKRKFSYKNHNLCKFVFMLLSLSCSHLFAIEPQVFKVGAFNNPPVIFKDDNGVFKGLYVDLLSEIGRKENIKFEYIFGTWQDGLDRIKTGDVDMLTSVAFSKERSLYLDYCKNPLLTVWGELYSTKSSDITGLLEANGKTIGVMKGDINAKIFLDLASSFNITCTVVEYPSYEDVFKAIASKNVNAGVAGITYGASKQKEYGLKATGVVFNPINIYFTTAKDKNKYLRTILDKYLDEWKHQQYSVFSQALQKWLYGSVGTVVKVPEWLIYVLIILVLSIIAAFVFILLLRFQVDSATQKIQLREKTLHDVEHNFKAMIDTLPLAIYLSVGVEQVNQYMNPTMFKLFGYTNEDIPTVKQWWPLAYPDEKYRNEVSEEWTRRVKHSIESQTPVEPMEVVVTCKNGSTKDILWSFIPIGDKNYSCGIDLTEQKKAENRIRKLLAEKEILLKEVHHRIKNNMNTLRSLLSLQESTLAEPSARKAIEDAGSRVGNMVVLYDSLYHSSNFSELSVKDYFTSLIDQIIFSFPNSKIVKVEKILDDFIVSVEKLQPIGIIVNELLTNIMKYAFYGKNSGLIEVSVSRTGTHAMITIQDDGIGMPESIDFDNSTGFGLMLVDALTKQINGNIRIERGNGTKVILEFDL